MPRKRMVSDRAIDFASMSGSEDIPDISRIARAAPKSEIIARMIGRKKKLRFTSRRNMASRNVPSASMHPRKAVSILSDETMPHVRTERRLSNPLRPTTPVQRRKGTAMAV